MFSEYKKEIRKASKELKKNKGCTAGRYNNSILNVVLKGTAAEGINLEIFEAYFEQISRQILDCTSEYYKFNTTRLFLNPHTNCWNSTINRITHSLCCTVKAKTKNRVIYCNFSG